MSSQLCFHQQFALLSKKGLKAWDIEGDCQLNIVSDSESPCGPCGRFRTVADAVRGCVIEARMIHELRPTRVSQVDLDFWVDSLPPKATFSFGLSVNEDYVDSSICHVEICQKQGSLQAYLNLAEPVDLQMAEKQVISSSRSFGIQKSFWRKPCR